MTTLEVALVGLGCLASGTLTAALLWSIGFPNQRIWPPPSYNAVIPLIAWILTVAIFGAAIGLGILGWGAIEISGWIRRGLGIPFFVIGNIVVWRGVQRLGLAATSGAESTLVTIGLYRFSRNPQYVADIFILIGIGLVSAAVWVWPVVGAGVLVLLLAPFAEEPWLRDRYGDAFDAYCVSTRRYI